MFIGSVGGADHELPGRRVAGLGARAHVNRILQKQFPLVKIQRCTTLPNTFLSVLRDERDCAKARMSRFQYIERGEN